VREVYLTCVLCVRGLNVIPHWLNTSSTLAVQKICNGNKYITPKYKYKYKYFTYKYKYSKNVLKYKYKYQVPHLWYIMILYTIIMAARQLCWPPTAGYYILLPMFRPYLFFRRLISKAARTCDIKH